MKKFKEFIFANSTFDVFRGIHFCECRVSTCVAEFNSAKGAKVAKISFVKISFL